jgi:hypothetical protein
MMTKPPGFASTSPLSMDDDEEESIDESLDEILSQANERTLQNPINTLDFLNAPLSPSDQRIDDLLGHSTASNPTPVPLPGMPRPQSDVTVLAPRPAVSDEVAEEETKVEPYETVVRAAASAHGDDLDDLAMAGLTSQASEKRERALRKPAPLPLGSRPPASPFAQAADDFEFEDPDAEASADAAADFDDGHTPADIPISEEDETDAAPRAGYAATSGSGGFQSRLPPPARSTPPPGRPDGYTSRRLHTPSSDYLPSPSGGYGSGAHYPSIAIPAPSTTETSARVNASLSDSRIRLPIGGLAGFLATAFGGGLLVGALIWRGHMAPPVASDKPVATQSASPPAGAIAPVSKRVAPTTTAEAPPKPAAAAADSPSAAAPVAAAVPSEEPPPPPRPARRAASRPKRAIALGAADDMASSDLPPAPKPKASKPKRTSAAAAAAWQDPFAQ